jgi:hypothetical protein
MLAHTLKKLRDGLYDKRLNEAMAESTAGKIRVSRVVVL